MKVLRNLGGLLSLAAIGSVKFSNANALSSPNPGPGVERAEERLAAKRKANEEIPSAHTFTRQQRRAQERAALKDRRSRFKKAMMEKRLPGGAAVIR